MLLARDRGLDSGELASLQLQMLAGGGLGSAGCLLVEGWMAAGVDEGRVEGV